ncbi:type I polyketide synthase [Streptomyces sp. NPDC044780]|uniref:type I polyketide synthase n=1 Tax=unclassified Streptomyces TaxID=2593676 RepID=UPI0033E7D52D
MSEQLPAVKQALVTIRKLQAQLAAEQRAKSEPIAIIGMGCRFPGDVTDPEGYWRLVDGGVDAVTEVPADRWRGGAVRWGAFLSDVDAFDAAFFGITPREAAAMDPQQRLLLEVAWGALENAGLPPDRLAGSRTGVFVGVVVNDYDKLSTGARDIYTVTGNGHSFPAGRLSYVLGLEGPCMAVDTACSSSLVAVHLACQSLRSGESTTALAGGVNLMLAPDMTDMMATAQALSPDGRCKTFDARANGYVRGEGCGVLVLKRLSDAVADGDPIHAVIRGSAVNSDGRSSGLTAPNVSAQRDLLRQALRTAGAQASDIGYVETHGTGTPLGDPIEVDALSDVLGAPRPDGSRCVLGAVKTNIGHLEAAAGVAGIIKAVLALRHERIPANLHLRTPNPRIDLTSTALTLAGEPTPWPKREGRPRMAGVSSFGISGTNAHLVLADPPAEAAPAAPHPQPPAGRAVLVPLSARDTGALGRLIDTWRNLLAGKPENVADLAYTAAVRRQHHPHRAAFLLTGQAEPRLVTTTAPQPSKVVFVFPGQGSQWLGMGRDLYAHEPVFRQTFVACDEAVRAETGWSLIEELHTDAAASRLERIDVVQPLLFVMQVSLAALWRAAGVEPDAVVGHSMGEVAAAHVAGALTLTDAARIICRRSRLMRRLSGQGAMLLVDLPAEDVQRALSPYADRVSVAASNSRRTTVVSGDRDAVEELRAQWADADVFCRLIKVEVASHSPQVEVLDEDLRQALAELEPATAKVRMYSTVLARDCDGGELGPGYWVRNLRAPVLFSQAVGALMSEGDTVFVEIAPHPVLLPAIEEDGGRVLPSSRRDHDERSVFLESLACLYTAGHTIDWRALHPGGGRCVDLPPYPFQRERYWVDTAPPPHPTTGHPLLGEPVSPATAPGTRIRQRTLRLPYLADHRVGGSAILPAAAYLEMALSAARTPPLLRDVSFEQMAVLGQDGTGTVQLVQEQDTFTIFARAADGGSWTRCARGTALAAETDVAPPPSAESPHTIRSRCPNRVTADEHYDGYARRGIDYGPAFRQVAQMWTGDAEALGRISLSGSPAGYLCHPALLDSCFQVLGALVPDQGPPAPVVPVGVGRMCVYRRPGDQVWVHARLSDTGDTGDLRVLDDDGQVLIEVDHLAVRRLTAAPSLREMCYEVAWRPVERPALPSTARPARGPWLVLADRSGVGTALVSLLEARGQECAVVQAHEMDPADDAAWESLLDRVLGERRECAGVVHLWSLDTTPTGHTTAQTLMADQRLTGLSTLSLVRALARRRWRDHPRLWLVTAGAQDAGGTPVAVSQAPLWGLARTLGLEHPEVACTRVDLAPRPEADQAAGDLVLELTAPDGEDEIALRPAGRYAARLLRSSPDAVATQPAFAPDGTFLITGGLGGLGLGLAEWLAAHGVRHLVLTGRSAPSPEARQRLESLTASGTEIVVHSADVTRREDLARVLADIDTRLPPLRGVVHAAMVLDDRTVMELDAERYDRVMAPKVQGAWNLHELTWGRQLDHFVLYSSAATLLGSPGQANYAAANAFLGALARHRRSLGAPALCVDWGLFSQAGIMAGRDGDGQRLAHRGIGTLTPEEGTEILGHLLPGTTPHLAALRVNLRQWLEFYPAAARASLFTELRGEEWATPPDPTADPDLAARLRDAAPAQRSRLVQEAVTGQLGKIMRIDAARIDTTAAFTSMGIDSLMALELRNRLESVFGIRLPVTALFASPTVADLAEQVVALLGIAEETPGPVTGNAPGPVARETPGKAAEAAPGDLDELGTDALLALIDDAVDRIEGGE